MSRVNYVAAAVDWAKTEEVKVDTLIRKCIKRVLGLPISTNTEKLERLGVHNKLAEIIEAQREAQRQRLLTTRAGRAILLTTGHIPVDFEAYEVKLDGKTRETYETRPIPRNIHPQFNEGRRAARAKALLKIAREGRRTSTFVDAARYGRSNKYVAVVTDPDGKLLNATSVVTNKPAIAEQVAIALAMADPSRPNIYSDSRTAVRAFLKGTIAKEAARIINNRSADDYHYITWFPAHMGHEIHENIPNANEMAHDCAREITRRGSIGRSTTSDWEEYRDPLQTFNEITAHYKLERKKYPAPHAKLQRPQSTAFRMLQTGSFPSRSVFSHFADDIEPHCTKCRSTTCSLSHMLWQCPALPRGDFITEEEWEEAIQSEEYRTQLRAVQIACERAEEQGLPPPAQVRPASVGRSH